MRIDGPWRLLSERSKAVRPLACLIAVATVVSSLSGPASASAQYQPKWGIATALSGFNALDNNPNFSVSVNSVSCTSGQNCVAGGSFLDSLGNTYAFVVSEVDGTWGNVIEVPTKTPNGSSNGSSQADARVDSISCTSSGNCSAGGTFTDNIGNGQAFVVGEVHGKWGHAIAIPTRTSDNSNNIGDGSVDSISCTSSGNCSAGGTFTDNTGNEQAFVVGEMNGTWGQAIQIPGMSSLDAGQLPTVNVVSCASEANCSAGGQFTDSAGNAQAYVVNERNGVWGRAIEVPSSAALDAGGGATTTSLSCATAGNCNAGGNYTDGSGDQQAFVVREVNGKWRRAIEVPGSAVLNAGGNANVASISCSSSGNCSAGGQYVDNSKHSQPFLVSELNGKWRRAIEVPGSAVLNSHGKANVVSISCTTSGNCSAVGTFAGKFGLLQAFVVNGTSVA